MNYKTENVDLIINKITTVWNYKENFWFHFPNLIPYFKEFHKKDKTPNKYRSSRVLWAIAMMYTPGSEYYLSPDEDKRKIMEDEVIEDKGYFKRNKEVVEEVIDKYKKLVHNTAAKRQYLAWVNLVEKRTKLMEETDYTLENSDALEKLIDRTPKIFQQLEIIKEMFEQEQKQQHLKAGSMPSMMD